MVIALAALAAVVVAVAAMAVLGIGGGIFARFQSGVRSMPAVGTWLADALGSVWNALHDWLYSSLAAGMGAVSSLFDTLWRPHDTLHRGSQQVGEAAANRFSRLRDVTLPLTRAEAVNTAASYTNQVERTIYGSLSATAADLNGRITQVDHALGEEIASVDFALTTALDTERRRAQAAERSIVTSTDTALGTVTATSAQRATEAAAYAASVAARVEHVATQDLAHLSAAVTADLGALGRYAEQVAGQAERNVRGAIDGEAATGLAGSWSGLRTATGQAQGGVVTAPTGVATTFPGLSEALPGTLAGALSALAAVTLTGVETLNRCATPYCAEKNTLGKALHAATELLTAAVGLGFIVAMVKEPIPTAADVVAVGGPLVTEASDAIRTLTGF